MTATKKGNVQRLPDAKLSEEALQARRQYQKQYRQANRERVRQWERNRWERAALKNKHERSSDNEKD